MVLILVLLTTLLLVVTILPFSHAEVWWIRGGDFPRLQIASAGLLLLVVQLLWLDLSHPAPWVLPILTSICVLYQAWWIWPYSPLHPKEVRIARHAPADVRIRIMVANVLMENRNADMLLEIIRDANPDVLVLLETNERWESQLTALKTEYSCMLKCPQENKYGMHLYSRLPFVNAQTRFLVDPGCPSMHANLKLRSGDHILLHCLHPTPPMPPESDLSGDRDAELILVGRRAARAKLPVIVTGDMNDVAWSATTRLFRKVSRLLDPRIGRGMFNTFHAGHFLMRWPLDHLFHSEHFTLVDIRRLPYFGSDHFPILVELALQPDRAEDQQGLRADEDDRAWADHITEAERYRPPYVGK